MHCNMLLNKHWEQWIIHLSPHYEQWSSGEEDQLGKVRTSNVVYFVLFDAFVSLFFLYPAWFGPVWSSWLDTKTIDCFLSLLYQGKHTSSAITQYFIYFVHILWKKSIFIRINRINKSLFIKWIDLHHNIMQYIQCLYIYVLIARTKAFAYSF